MKRVLHSPEDRDEIFERFFAYLEEWKVRLVLREWDIILHRELEGLDTQWGLKAGGQTECWPQYHRAFISLYVPDDSEWEDRELEDTAVHELMHVLVSPWRVAWQATHRGSSPQRDGVLKVFEEQLCTRLALGFMRTKYPRRKAHSSSVDGQQTKP
jgi:hypothetical protein